MCQCDLVDVLSRVAPDIGHPAPYCWNTGSSCLLQGCTCIITLLYSLSASPVVLHTLASARFLRVLLSLMLTSSFTVRIAIMRLLKRVLPYCSPDMLIGNDNRELTLLTLLLKVTGA